MYKFLRPVVFAFTIFMTMFALRPVSLSNAFASEPGPFEDGQEFDYPEPEQYEPEPSVFRVRLVINGNTTVHETTTRTVEDFMEEQGIELHPNDIIKHVDGRRISDNMSLRIDRAFYTTVVVDGEPEQINVSPGTTAGDLLNSYRASLGTDLMFDGNEHEELSTRSVLNLTSRRSETEFDTEAIPYESEFILSPDLAAGAEEVRREGVPGEKRTEYQVIFVGNREHSREITDEIITPPVNRIVERGTGENLAKAIEIPEPEEVEIPEEKEEPATAPARASAVSAAPAEPSRAPAGIYASETFPELGSLTDTSSPNFRYSKRLTMNASAYTAEYCCTGKSPGHPAYGITASGRKTEHGIVSVDPGVIPLGTKLYVEGYGYALAADTGSAIRGNKIDLFVHTMDEAKRFGRRNVTVYILD